MKKGVVTALLSASLIFIGSAEAGGKEGAKWGYKGDIGPDKWGDLSPKYKLCKTGKEQSPIDIRNTKKADLPKINFNYQKTKLNVVNNGHTIKVKYDKGSYIKYEDRRCDLLQFHFHTPSEHLINGRAFPMEVHFVHKCDDGNLLVIGVMMRQGKENPVIEDIWNVMPKKAGKTVESDLRINAKDLLPKNRAYYTYPGSLTTPPCSEGVTWIVMKEGIEVSQEQIDEFRKLYDMNSRPVQPINDRTIKESM